MNKTGIGWTDFTSLRGRIGAAAVEDGHSLSEATPLLSHSGRKRLARAASPFHRKREDAFSLFLLDDQVRQECCTQQLGAFAVKTHDPLRLPIRVSIHCGVIVEFDGAHTQLISEPENYWLVGHSNHEHRIEILPLRAYVRDAEATVAVCQSSNISPLLSSQKSDWISWHRCQPSRLRALIRSLTAFLFRYINLSAHESNYTKSIGMV